MNANHAFHRAFTFEYQAALAEIEQRKERGDKYPVASQIGALMNERDRLLGEGYVHDADILTDVIDTLGERLPYPEELC